MTIAHTPAHVEDLVAQGRLALGSTGDLRAARSWFEQAWTEAVRQDLPRAQAEAALGLGGLWVHEHREDAEWARIFARQKSCARLPGIPAGLALALRTRMAAELDYLDGTHSRVLEALEPARRSGDPEVLATALSLAHHCLLGPQHGERRTRLAEELLLTAGRSARPADTLAGMLWLTVDQFLGGDPRAGRSLARLRDALKQNDHLAFGFVAAAIDVMLAIRGGELERAEEMAAECAALGERCGDADASGWHRAQLITIRWFQGRLPELLPRLKDEVDSSTLGVQDDSLMTALAVAASAAGDDLVAAGAVARLGAPDLAAVVDSSSWLVTVYGAAEAAARLQDTALATTVYRLLEPYRDLPVTGSLAVTCFGSAQQALGLAALTTGDLETGIEHLRHAVQGNLALGHWPAHCLSLYRLGSALLRHGERDEGARALATAEQEAARFGMVLPQNPIPGTAPGRPGVRIGLLGPVEILVDGVPRPVPGQRRRTVLSVLALHAGELVGADRLIDIVWGESAPRTAANTLQSHISFLRRVLGPSAPIVSKSQGYLLDLPRQSVDVGRAEHLLDDQRTSPERLGEALALWRGEPLCDVESHPWLDVQAQRLGQLRLQATKRLAQAHLRSRWYSRAVDLLTPAAREHPLDEQLHEYLMLALYRQGLPSQALRVFEDLRATLRDELGIYPSVPLRNLHGAILRQDPSA